MLNLYLQTTNFAIELKELLLNFLSTIFKANLKIGNAVLQQYARLPSQSSITNQLVEAPLGICPLAAQGRRLAPTFDNVSTVLTEQF